MQCPQCKTEAKIRSNRLVERADGSLAYRMDFECRTKKCPSYKQIIATEYDPVTPTKDE